MLLPYRRHGDYCDSATAFVLPSPPYHSTACSWILRYARLESAHVDSEFLELSQSGLPARTTRPSVLLPTAMNPFSSLLAYDGPRRQRIPLDLHPGTGRRHVPREPRIPACMPLFAPFLRRGMVLNAGGVLALRGIVALVDNPDGARIGMIPRHDPLPGVAQMWCARGQTGEEVPECSRGDLGR